MTEAKRLSVLTRLGARAMRTMTRVAMGYDPVFLDRLLDLLGPREVGAWGREVNDTVAALETHCGAATTQHVIAFSAFFNGCPFCSVGHTYAGNLELFRATGRLFPIDERDVLKLQRLDDDQLLRTLATKLGADDQETFERIVQMYELKTNLRTARTEVDDLMLRAVAAWDIITECTIVLEDVDPATVDPLTEIAKDKTLQDRYQQARGRG
ncbi:MAG: hypothetical protein AAGA54_23910 [Myxococcota bacterium]